MLALSNKWAPILVSQPKTGMGCQIASVSLRGGRTFEQLVIVGRYIKRIGENKYVPFGEEDIETIPVSHGK